MLEIFQKWYERYFFEEESILLLVLLRRSSAWCAADHRRHPRPGAGGHRAGLPDAGSGQPRMSAVTGCPSGRRWLCSFAVFHGAVLWHSCCPAAAGLAQVVSLAGELPRMIETRAHLACRSCRRSTRSTYQREPAGSWWPPWPRTELAKALGQTVVSFSLSSHSVTCDPGTGVHAILVPLLVFFLSQGPRADSRLAWASCRQ